MHSPGHREPPGVTPNPPAGRGEGEEEQKLDRETGVRPGGWTRIIWQKRDLGGVGKEQGQERAVPEAKEEVQWGQGVGVGSGVRWGWYLNCLRGPGAERFWGRKTFSAKTGTVPGKLKRLITWLG